ncbi:RICIN domain-containing protein [Streptomyces sp. NPDC014746]|uniref:RICIN domain-containing protein n=1 Tax=Streptomyces sp. NPDC014746 TaxID=3364904 RepID=UPI0036FD5D4E
MRRAAALALLLTTVLPVVPAVPAQAQTRGPGTYTIRVLHSDKCLDVQGSSHAQGALIVQNTCDGRPSQRFSISYASRPAGVFFVQTFAGMCWRRTGGEGYPNTTHIPIGQYTCDRRDLEFFGFTTTPGVGGEELRNVSAKGEERLCLHVRGASPADGADLITHLCNLPTGTGQRNDTFVFRSA